MYINWIFSWPEEALYTVAKYFISRVSFKRSSNVSNTITCTFQRPFQSSIILQQYKDIVVNHIVYTHLSMNGYNNTFLAKLKRRNYLTPTNYLDYINSYLNLVDEKLNVTTQQVINRST